MSNSIMGCNIALGLHMHGRELCMQQPAHNNVVVTC